MSTSEGASNNPGGGGDMTWSSINGNDSNAPSTWDTLRELTVVPFTVGIFQGFASVVAKRRAEKRAQREKERLLYEEARKSVADANESE